MSEQYAFIGGPMDSEQRETGGSPTIRVARRSALLPEPFDDDDKDVLAFRPTQVPAWTYRLERFIAADEAIIFAYVEESLSPREADLGFREWYFRQQGVDPLLHAGALR